MRFGCILREVCTNKNLFHCQGHGVHSGKKVSVVIQPDGLDGIRFQRTDLGSNALIPADWQCVSSTDYQTTLTGPTGASVSMVEHLMAAFWALGIRSALVMLDGPEIPVLDGSSGPWLQLLKDFPRGQAPKKPIFLRQSCEVSFGSSFLRIEPASSLSIDMRVVLDDGSVQRFSYQEEEDFSSLIGRARTFCFQKNIAAMQKKGLGQGGSLDNALVLQSGIPLNPGGFRSKQECAQHKILDFLGDWALSGHDIKGRVIGLNSGHGLNYKLLCQVMKQLLNSLDQNWKKTPASYYGGLSSRSLSSAAS